jgi:general secretion pathway protein A
MDYDYWGLRESPFCGDFAERFFYWTSNSEEALARLHFLADHHRRLGLVLGSAGIGKTQLLRAFDRRMRRSGRQVAQVSALGIGPEEFLSLVAQEFGLLPAPGAKLAALWRLLDDFFRASRYQSLESVVLVDDADEAEPNLLAQVARLAQGDFIRSAQLMVVISSRDDRLASVGTRLLELAELRVDLEPWHEGDLEGFLRQALRAAGQEREIFTPPAITRLHEITAGVPRRAKQLAELSLLAGAGARLHSIDAGTVESVFRELGVAMVGPAIEA